MVLYTQRETFVEGTESLRGTGGVVGAGRGGACVWGGAQDLLQATAFWALPALLIRFFISDCILKTNVRSGTFLKYRSTVYEKKSHVRLEWRQIALACDINRRLVQGRADCGNITS